MRTIAIFLITLVLQSFPSTLIAAVPIAERDALVTLYNSTNGGNWTVNTNWLVGDPCEDNWVGIKCDEANTVVGGVWLWNNNLDGQIPAELGDLASLQALYLDGNQLSGQIPPELGNLTLLLHLYLNSNQLTGSIPPELGNLTLLELLFLESNQLSGQIPAELGDLASLQALYLDDNQLSGQIPPELGNLTLLLHLYLNNNQLTGSIPPELGNLTLLELLFLESNQLSGQIPLELGDILSLETLALGLNQLTGPIPSALGNIPRLKVLDLFNNQLTGSIPPELGSLTSLLALTLQDNNLSGSIPFSLKNLKLLRFLYLHQNQITGPIPAELGEMSGLESLNLSNNDLTGEIPSELGNLTKLNGMGLHFNKLTGSIPSTFGKLSNLRTLNLINNQLNGTIPPELGNLAKLSWLYLYDNQLTGTIPPELSNLSDLNGLMLYNNQLTGTIPPEFGSMASLRFFRLENNHLSGEIPPELGGLGSATEFALNGNRLTGTIPPELRNLTGLDWIHLNGNQLDGPIPPELINLTNLEEAGIWVEWNKLYAQDPSAQEFLDSKNGIHWSFVQTVSPPNVHVSETGHDYVKLDWYIDEIAIYLGSEGGDDLTQRYRVWYRTSPDGPYIDGGAAPDKSSGSHTVTGLSTGTTYYFVVRTETDSHQYNQNDLVSEPSPEVSTRTLGPSATFSVGGTVSGLTRTGLMLQNNGIDTLAITVDGPFIFATELPVGDTYLVTVSNQPSGQTCTVDNGAGTLSAANVTHVQVTCTTNTFSVGGTVTGLEGSGLVLQKNAGDDLNIEANGNFTFATPLDDGSTYVVTVVSRPSLPSQTCIVSNGSGNLAGENATDVIVTCTINTFTIGGKVYGLTSGNSVTLQNNNSDDLVINANGRFTFATPLPDGTTYSITIIPPPLCPSSTCTIKKGNGTVNSANIYDVMVELEGVIFIDGFEMQ